MCAQSEPGSKWQQCSITSGSHAHRSRGTASRSECRSQAADSVNFGLDFALVITSEALGMKVLKWFPYFCIGAICEFQSFGQDLPILHTG